MAAYTIVLDAGHGGPCAEIGQCVSSLYNVQENPTEFTPRDFLIIVLS